MSNNSMSKEELLANGIHYNNEELIYACNQIMAKIQGQDKNGFIEITNQQLMSIVETVHVKLKNEIDNVLFKPSIKIVNILSKFSSHEQSKINKIVKEIIDNAIIDMSSLDENKLNYIKRILKMSNAL
jgi:hypothetical protein